ncbi:SAM-dependent methyltransferase [Tumebacillus permanentifrigoris]|uniref:SAM-dependent methyltransferase n=1 Tax=Tumebacillus permanentifrigoris TaxID=378543 RepID=A0A316D5R5_9BACL|nr:SAM-dependent methyltransferase [Tumebacillus permanentifrigoris]PWK07415.1 hypothetical protein C7459_11713 [Tumebacillus permanentifrigoris]
MSETHNYDLKHVVFVGRTWRDYSQMFNLTEADLRGRNVLDCPGGAASFTMTARDRGFDVTACDIAYHFSPAELLPKGLSDLETVRQLVDAHPNAAAMREKFPHFANMVNEMTETLHETVADMQKHGYGTRYVPGSLPNLPFTDQQFDLTLSGNLLFVYSDQLGLEFHLEATRELMRVTREEIRLFPLISLNQQVSPFLPAVLELAEAEGWGHEQVRTSYDLLEQGTQMLVLRRSK